MDIFGLKALENILYREDELKERTRLVFKWVTEDKLTQDEFDKLIDSCNEESIARDKARRYGKEQAQDDSIKSDDAMDYWCEQLSLMFDEQLDIFFTKQFLLDNLNKWKNTK